MTHHRSRFRFGRKPPLARLVRRAARPFRRRTRPGAAPGSYRIDPHAPAPAMTVIAYGPGADEYYEAALPNDRIDDLSDLLQKYPVVWLNVDGLGDAAVIEQLGTLFDLHPLALEDVVHSHQRAKVEDYDERLFIVARQVAFENGHGAADAANDGNQPAEKGSSPKSQEAAAARAPGDLAHPESEQVSLFLGPNFVLTFQDRPGDSLDPVRVRLRKRRGRIREFKADYLAYALLDAVVDGYFPMLEELGGRLEALDREMLVRTARDQMARLHWLRGDLLLLRKNLWPQREAIHALLRDPHPLISSETILFLRDCYDHTVQLMDVVETYRELCADLREYHYALVGTRTNEVMKVLTIISTIFIPLSFLAGVYGMNFDPRASRLNMPELESPYGYPAVLSLMAAVALALLYYFWRKGWLGDDE